MKIFHYLFVALLFFAVSCTETIENPDGITPPVEEPKPVEPVCVPLSIGSIPADADNLQSRAGYENSVTKWEEGDKIALYALSYDQTAPGQTAELAATRLSADSKCAHFDGMGPEPAEQDSYFAVYPSDSPINSSQATFTIGSTQPATAAPKLLLAGQATDQLRDEVKLKFHTANAFLCVKFANELNLTSVRFEGCDNESVAGTYVYNFADGTMTLTGTEKSITIENPGTEFYFTLPAITLSKGYKLTFVKGAEQMVKSYGYGKPASFESGLLYTTPTVTEFTPTAIVMGTVQTSFDSSLRSVVSDGSIVVEECLIKGMPNTLISEVGITLIGSDGVPHNYPAALSPQSKTFSLTISPLKSDNYSVHAYIKGLDNAYATQSTAKTDIGVIAGAISVELAAANTSLSTLTRSTGINHGEIGISGSYANIGDALIAERGLLINGNRHPATTDNSTDGTIDAVHSNITSNSYQVGAYIKDRNGRYYDSPAVQNQTVDVIETPVLTLAGGMASNADAIYTTYDSRSNSEDGSSIYFKGNIATIASGIDSKLLNSGAFSMELQLDGGAIATATLSDAAPVLSYTATKANVSWAAHTVNSVLKYNGTAVCEVSKTVHVTGLPYAVTPTNSGAQPWSTLSGTNISWSGDGALLATAGGAPSVKTPDFHIPGNIDIAVTTKYTKNSGSIGKYTYSVSLHNGGSTIISHEHNKKGTYNLTGNSTFTSQYKSLKCAYTYAVAGNNVTVNTLSIQYR